MKTKNCLFLLSDPCIASVHFDRNVVENDQPWNKTWTMLHVYVVLSGMRKYFDKLIVEAVQQFWQTNYRSTLYRRVAVRHSDADNDGVEYGISVDSRKIADRCADARRSHESSVNRGFRSWMAFEPTANEYGHTARHDTKMEFFIWIWISSFT